MRNDFPGGNGPAEGDLMPAVEYADVVRNICCVRAVRRVGLHTTLATDRTLSSTRGIHSKLESLLQIGEGIDAEIIHVIGERAFAVDECPVCRHIEAVHDCRTDDIRIADREKGSDVILPVASKICSVLKTEMRGFQCVWNRRELRRQEKPAGDRVLRALLVIDFSNDLRIMCRAIARIPDAAARIISDVTAVTWLHWIIAPQAQFLVGDSIDVIGDAVNLG